MVFLSLNSIHIGQGASVTLFRQTPSPGSFSPNDSTVSLCAYPSFFCAVAKSDILKETVDLLCFHEKS